MMDSLASIGFTDEDFKLIRKGLQNLAKDSGIGGMLARTLVEGLPGGNNSFMRTSFKEMEEKEAREKEILEDQVTTILYKVVRFKEFLKQPVEPLRNQPYAAPASEG